MITIALAAGWTPHRVDRNSAEAAAHELETKFTGMAYGSGQLPARPAAVSTSASVNGGVTGAGILVNALDEANGWVHLQETS